MNSDQERKDRRERLAKATAKAKKVLRKGDRVTVRSCPGTKRWIIFDHWQGFEIYSASGRGEYAATSVSKVNGVAVDFTADR